MNYEKYPIEIIVPLIDPIKIKATITLRKTKNSLAFVDICLCLTEKEFLMLKGWRIISINNNEKALKLDAPAYPTNSGLRKSLFFKNEIYQRISEEVILIYKSLSEDTTEEFIRKRGLE